MLGDGWMGCNSLELFFCRRDLWFKHNRSRASGERKGGRTSLPRWPAGLTQTRLELLQKPLVSATTNRSERAHLLSRHCRRIWTKSAKQAFMQEPWEKIKSTYPSSSSTSASSLEATCPFSASESVINWLILMLVIRRLFAFNLICCNCSILLLRK